MESAITAIGTANPIFKRTQQETADLIINALKLSAVEARLLRSVYKSTGIKQRHSVLSDYCKSPGEFEFFPNQPDAPFPTTAARMQIYKDNALQLALNAIDDCFNSAKINIANITHLITVSCTGMYAPGIDIEIVQYLNLNSSVNRTSINFMGCYGAFNGMKVADAICKSDSSAKVLVICIELCTIHFQRDFSITNLLSNAIFADGAAAILIEPKPLHKKCLRLSSFYCDLLPQTNKEMAWAIADNGFDIVLSTYVPQAIESGIQSFVNKFLNTKNLSTTDIDLYAIHPGGIKILEACETALGISKNDNRFSYQVLENFGNMSSPTILFVLKNIWDAMTSDDCGKTIFSCAFGPGLTLESSLLKISA